jgi:CheY-like chemotaxis protein
MGERDIRVEHELRRVLIVEDDACIREALAECVASLGIEVITSADGQDGLEQLRPGRLPDAILLDLRMPRLDGNGFLVALRANPATADIPVIVMTASHDQLQGPVRAFLEKPFDLDELAKILNRLGREGKAA